ncbi:hypothetical protein PPERSA_02478 [Pseudocohnilembus persalinus]|uniref:Uncharacterized protein n=1 Tax=Pseudocohnilembus persalinus TaxID=266149 RepID=A0A0V0QAV8_PSEPJ|nr:hypothetical protein PPERSA_02478 [Pseudocohnilembus persalinus]|eukprot:KRW99366.1 hypothetical protein PPERSA_02478 [Pseudocohnilembus persalinus]
MDILAKIEQDQDNQKDLPLQEIIPQIPNQYYLEQYQQSTTDDNSAAQQNPLQNAQYSLKIYNKQQQDSLSNLYNQQFYNGFINKNIENNNQHQFGSAQQINPYIQTNIQNNNCNNQSQLQTTEPQFRLLNFHEYQRELFQSQIKQSTIYPFNTEQKTQCQPKNQSIHLVNPNQLQPNSHTLQSVIELKMYKDMSLQEKEKIIKFEKCGKNSNINRHFSQINYQFQNKNLNTQKDNTQNQSLNNLSINQIQSKKDLQLNYECLKQITKLNLPLSNQTRLKNHQRFNNQDKQFQNQNYQRQQLLANIDVSSKRARKNKKKPQIPKNISTTHISTNIFNGLVSHLIKFWHKYYRCKNNPQKSYKQIQKRQINDLNPINCSCSHCADLNLFLKFKRSQKNKNITNFQELWSQSNRIKIISEDYFIHYSSTNILNKFENVTKKYKKKQNSKNDGRYMIYAYQSLSVFLWGIDNKNQFVQFKK